MQLVVPGLWTFTGLLAGRVYLIDDPDGLTLVDTGLPLAPARIERQLSAAGRQLTEVRRILITHAHPDHIGGLAALQRQTGARVIASAIEQPVIEGRARPLLRPVNSGAGPSRLLRRLLGEATRRLAGVSVDQTVGEGTLLAEVMGGLQVLFTPGHTLGHLSFWQPERRILLCGDVMVRQPELCLPFALVTTDMAENRRSVARLVELQPAVIAVGHGPPLVEGAAVKLRAFNRRINPERQPGGA